MTDAKLTLKLPTTPEEFEYVKKELKTRPEGACQSPHDFSYPCDACKKPGSDLAKCPFKGFVPMLVKVHHLHPVYGIRKNAAGGERTAKSSS